MNKKETVNKNKKERLNMDKKERVNMDKKYDKYIQELKEKGIFKDENVHISKEVKTFKNIIDKAIKEKYKKLAFKNIYSFVVSCGYDSNYMIEIIKKLRENGTIIYFVDDNLNTENMENDLMIGKLLGEITIYECMMIYDSEVSN